MEDEKILQELVDIKKILLAYIMTQVEPDKLENFINNFNNSDIILSNLDKP